MTARSAQLRWYHDEKDVSYLWKEENAIRFKVIDDYWIHLQSADSFVIAIYFGEGFW